MTDRSLMPDYLRLAALFGIVVVNVGFIAFPILQGPAAAADPSALDQAVELLVNGLASMKIFGLFSFMFGVGLAFQIQSAERRGLPAGRLHRNRMLGLILLGVLHGLLFFPGDILALYGVAGALLWRLRNRSVRGLVRLGAGLAVGGSLLWAGLALVPGEPPPLPPDAPIMTDGSLADVLARRALNFAIVWPLALLMQGPIALGWFCLGLAAVRSGMIDAPAHPLWRRARVWALAPGLAVSLLGAAVLQAGSEPAGWALILVAAPVATAGYLGLIAAVSRPPSARFRPILQAGGRSLTIYLGQSILLGGVVFVPFGLDLWGAVGLAAAVALALATTCLLIGLTILWNRRFAQRPFEWVLRRITLRGVAPTPPTPPDEGR
ncbi:MAG: DUF418 domain-containing protein [Pseudomonadota bacterium]